MILPLAAALAMVAGAATPEQSRPSFEAASVKIAKSSARQSRPQIQGGPGSSDPGRIRFLNISLRHLILLAYRVRDFQLATSDPKGLDANTYEIVAGLPQGTTAIGLSAMVQNLLAERFHLAAHREHRRMAGYRLTVAKGGPKLRPSAEAAPASEDADFDPLPPAPPNELEVHADGYPDVPPREGSWLVALRSGYARTRQLNASMAYLAGILANQLERPVTDATGLQGRYEFTLSWMTSVPAAGAAEPGPDIFAALRQQLGLQLEAEKAPAEVLVIDRFEKDPTEN